MNMVAMIPLGLAMYQVSGEALYTSFHSSSLESWEDDVITSIVTDSNSESLDDFS